MQKKLTLDTIQKYFFSLQKKVFVTQDLHDIFKDKQEEWELSKDWKGRDFIHFLLEEEIVINKQFNAKTSRYLVNEPSAIEVAIETYPNSYFSHYTAMQYHGLTEQLPKSIYVTYEQLKTENNKSTLLKQKSIDDAFSNDKHRVIKNKTTVYQNRTIYWHSKKVTQSIGIIQRSVFSKKLVGITNVERTLIDAVMRPLYAGGSYEILKAFENAAPRLSVNKLCSYLKKIAPIYPYHQCIGFYMDKTGLYKPKQLELVQKFEKKNKFYLSYGMQKMEYSEKWMLFYPKGF